MTNPVQPTTPLIIGGVKYELLFDLEAIAHAEDLTDRPLLTGFKQRDWNTPTISFVRALLYACIRAKQPDITYDFVKTLVTRKTLAEIWGAVLNAWVKGLAEPDEDAVEENPLKDQS
jgi:hypothetical protein